MSNGPFPDLDVPVVGALELLDDGRSQRDYDGSGGGLQKSLGHISDTSVRMCNKEVVGGDPSIGSSKMGSALAQVARPVKNFYSMNIHGPHSFGADVVGSHSGGVHPHMQSSDSSIPSGVALNIILNKHIRFMHAARSKNKGVDRRRWRKSILANSNGKTDDDKPQKDNEGAVHTYHNDEDIFAAAEEEANQAIKVGKSLGVSIDDEAQVMQKLIEVEVFEAGGKSVVS